MKLAAGLNRKSIASRELRIPVTGDAPLAKWLWAWFWRHHRFWRGAVSTRKHSVRAHTLRICRPALRMREAVDMSEFTIGDMVRNGQQVATVTDVGTVLIAITIAMGAFRMVCPWELIRLRAAQHDRGSARNDTGTTS